MGLRGSSTKTELMAILKTNRSAGDEFRAEQRARDDKNNFDTFKVGDPVHWAAGSDCEPGTVCEVTPSAIFVHGVKAVLLNGVDSGEPDALTFEPGGFVGHTSGTQRHRFDEFPELVGTKGKKFTKRAATARRGAKAKEKGTSIHGSMSSWGILYHGHVSHYDYNF